MALVIKNFKVVKHSVFILFHLMGEETGSERSSGLPEVTQLGMVGQLNSFRSDLTLLSSLLRSVVKPFTFSQRRLCTYEGDPKRPLRKDFCTGLSPSYFYALSMEPFCSGLAQR